MAYQLAVPLRDGSTDMVIFQVDSSEVPDSLVLASSGAGGAVDQAKVALESALTKVKPSLEMVIEVLKDLSPDETSIDFGLSIGGEYGMVIAKGTAEVNFAVHMTWKRSHDAEAGVTP